MELKNIIQPLTPEEAKQKKLDSITEQVPDELVTKEDYAKLCRLYLKANNKQLTDQEFVQFLLMCYQSKLNPWKRQAYAVRYGSDNPFQVITGYQVYIERASESGLLDWWEVEIIEGQPQTTETGQVQDPKPYKAIFRGKRKDSSKEISFTYWFKEWNQGHSTWIKKPYFMLEKVAIANSFRRWFPKEIDGLPYTIEENWTNLEEVNKQIEMQNKTIDKYEEKEKEKEKVKVNAF